MQILIVFSAAFFLLVGDASAQTPTDIDTFRQTVLNKRLILRNFDASDRIQGTWAGARLELKEPDVKTFGVFIPNRFTVTGSEVEIQGARQVVTRTEDGKLAISPGSEDVQVGIDLGETPAAQAFATLKDQLFYSSLSDALRGMSEGRRQFFTGPITPAKKPDVYKVCDCADPKANGCSENELKLSMQGMKPPTVRYHESPEYPAGASASSASIGFSFTVEASGAMNDIWLVRSAGFGFDAAAAKAIVKYRFNPATCHSKPVPLPLFIDVNFAKG